MVQISTLGEWMISISNSKSEDFQSMTENRLFVPHKVTIIAGEPYTLTAELSGTQFPKSLYLESISDISNPLMVVSPPRLTRLINNRITFISIYQPISGDYLLALNTGFGSSVREVHLTVVPSEFTTIRVTKEGYLAPVLEG